MDEKRRNVRVNKSIIVSFRVKPAFLRNASRSENISCGGIRLPVPQKFAAGTLLEMEIRADNFPPIRVIGKVKWVKDKPSAENPFEAGVEFVEIASTSKEKWEQLCNAAVSRGEATWIE